MIKISKSINSRVSNIEKYYNFQLEKFSKNSRKLFFKEFRKKEEKFNGKNKNKNTKYNKKFNSKKKQTAKGVTRLKILII